MKGTKRTSVIAIALALVLALSVLVGAGTDPTMNENGTQPVNNEGTADGVITFNVVCACHPGNPGNPVDATITGTAHYVLDPDSVVQPAEPTTTPSAEPTPTPTTAVEPSEDQVSTQADDQANDPADDSSDADDPSDENQDQDQEQPKPDPTKDEKFEGTAADIEIAKTLTEENGAKYNLASVDYTVTAAGFEPKKGTNDAVGSTITVKLTNPAPRITEASWDPTSGTLNVGAKDDYDEKAIAILIRNDVVAEAVDNGTFRTHFSGFDKVFDGNNLSEDVIAVQNEIRDYVHDELGKDEEYGPYLVFGNGTNAGDAWTHGMKDNGTFDPFTSVGTDNDTSNYRVLLIIDAHGNARAKVLNKYFEVSVDYSQGEWSSSKDAKVTVKGAKICEDKKITTEIFTNNNIRDYYVAVYDDQGNMIPDGIWSGKAHLKNKEFSFTRTINKAGKYTVELWKDKGESCIERYEFLLADIDTTAPTVDVTYNTTNVINQIDVTAEDKGGSGLAGVSLGAVEFGWKDVGKEERIVLDTNDDGSIKTDSGNEITTTITVPIYKGTCNGVECGEEVHVKLPDRATNKTDLTTYKDNAQSEACGNAKTYFRDDTISGKEAAAIAKAVAKPIDATQNSETIKTAKDGSGNEYITSCNYTFSGDDLAKLPKTKPEALIIWAKDNAGNYSVLYTLGTATKTENNDRTIIIDTVDPKVTEVTVKTLNDDKYSNSSEINIEATIKDSNIAENGVYATLFKDGVAIEGKDKIELSSTPAKDANSEVIEGTYEATGSVKVPDGEGYTVVVYAEDKAGNTSYTVEGEKMIPNEETAKSSAFIVDTTAPMIGTLKFTPADATGDEHYFKVDRKLEIKIDELHLASGEFVYTDIDTANPVPIKEALEWSDGVTGNIDNDNLFSHVFSEKGKYQLVSMTLTDKAGNTTVYSFDGETEGVKMLVDQFTIDKTAPQIKVVYSNQTPANGKYFNEDRTATITVTEHNFNEKYTIVKDTFKVDEKTESGTYIIITQNDKDASQNDANREIDATWTQSAKNKDEYTLNIKYKGNVNYVFNVIVVDKAGNQNADIDYKDNESFAPGADNDFDVDKEPPKITIAGVTNGSAYNGEVGGTVEYKDANFQSATIRLMRADKNGVYDVTAQHTTALPTGAPGGTVNLINFDRLLTNDGIYTLTATVVDMAGNTAENTVTFSVNRFGSTYKFDDYLASICDKHIKSVTDDLKITEINPDSITSGAVTITRNGKVIDSGDIAAVLQRSGSASGGWYEYLYTISKDLFKEDGMYKIVVSSKDAAGNEPNSENDEEFEIVFWVDDTPAEIAGIQGLEDAIINAENHTVKFTVRDNIGLKSVTVYCDSKEIAKFGEKDFTAGDLVDAQFTISEASSAQHIRIVAEDLSGNILDTDGTIEGSANTTVSFERDVTVSTNFFVRWFANKPLFFGSIAVIVAAGVGIYFIVAKKHKKEEATAE